MHERKVPWNQPRPSPQGSRRSLSEGLQRLHRMRKRLAGHPLYLTAPRSGAACDLVALSTATLLSEEPGGIPQASTSQYHVFEQHGPAQAARRPSHWRWTQALQALPPSRATATLAPLIHGFAA